ncbi:MAG: type II toxin-antitoxin system VapC family toxin [Cytophagales bacterium]|nr:type II toxin-antitoxin system VapC family toxin [Cytophagales bacterium]
MKQKIYIDNSVLGGYFDKDFEQDTRKLFDRIRKGDFIIHLSEISELELLEAPEYVKDLKKEIPNDCLVILELNEDAEYLAENYIKEKILTESSMNDAYHIAIATVNRIDVLISWNFRHIVNLNKIRLFNSVNLKLGFPQIDIRTPKELINYED